MGSLGMILMLFLCKRDLPFSVSYASFSSLHAEIKLPRLLSPLSCIIISQSCNIASAVKKQSEAKLSTSSASTPIFRLAIEVSRNPPASPTTRSDASPTGQCHCKSPSPVLPHLQGGLAVASHRFGVGKRVGRRRRR